VAEKDAKKKRRDRENEEEIQGFTARAGRWMGRLVEEVLAPLDQVQLEGPSHWDGREGHGGVVTLEGSKKLL